MNQNQSAPSPMGNKPKIKPWLLIVLAVVVLAAIGFFVWNVQQNKKIATPTLGASTTTSTISTADWKTYTNSTFSYSLKYPSDWTLVAGESASSYGNNSISITSPASAKKISDYQKLGSKSFGPTAADIVITYNETIANTYGGLGGSQPKTLAEYIQSPGFTLASAINFAGESAYEYIAAGDISSYRVAVIKNNHLYVIQCYSNIKSKNDLSAEQKAILSTFQFTE